MDQIGDVLSGFAAIFTGESPDDGEIVHPERLDRGRLDYSPASIAAVDDYLAYLNTHRPESDEQRWACTVLGTGAYLGEVMRRAATPPRPRTCDDPAAGHPKAKPRTRRRDRQLVR